MKFEQIQAIEYSLSVIDGILERARRTEPLNLKLVFKFEGKLFTANTYEISTDEAPKLLTLDSTRLRVSEKYYYFSDEDETILFLKTRYSIYSKFGNINHPIELLERKAFLLEYLKELTDTFDYSTFEHFQTIFTNVKFLESGLELPFLDLGEDINNVEIVSMIPQ